MTVLILVFGLLAGCLLNVLVGLVGSKRKIGFGWTFFWSLVFTPLVGLVIALISDPLPQGEQKWGCLVPFILSFLFLLLLALLLSMLGFMAIA
mgnify:FL=1